MKVRGLGMALAAVFAGLGAPHAFAQSADMALCKLDTADDSRSRERIAACKRVVAAEEATAHALYQSLFDRSERNLSAGVTARQFADLNVAIGVHPDHADAFIKRGNYYAENDQPTKALVDYNRALELDSANLTARLYRGVAYYATGDLDAAIKDYDAVLARVENGQTYLNRGAAYAGQGNYTKAIADMEKSFQIDASLRTGPATAGLAWIYSRRGTQRDDADNLAGAVADFDTAIRLDPKSSSALNGRCWARATRKVELEKALADCNAALAIEPEAPEIKDSRALVHLQRGDLQAALKDFQAALGPPGTEGREHSLYGLGIVKLRLGRTTEGNADIVAALSADPTLGQEYAIYGVKP